MEKAGFAYPGTLPWTEILPVKQTILVMFKEMVGAIGGFTGWLIKATLRLIRG